MTTKKKISHLKSMENGSKRIKIHELQFTREKSNSADKFLPLLKSIVFQEDLDAEETVACLSVFPPQDRYVLSFFFINLIEKVIALDGSNAYWVKWFLIFKLKLFYSNQAKKVILESSEMFLSPMESWEFIIRQVDGWSFQTIISAFCSTEPNISIFVRREIWKVETFRMQSILQ